ncbi:hypothetical protein COCCADRAFT_93186 [Bipolaris zeicola 26-R-13]|uniref:Uncharacterized protein n=1 Tax=Cochliobolus carbonum (strain 26-R-13) TaxID=930089 RepID=W6YST0_COCC2|nr:uncharacterized protein COCCADRAFT_93186 [Bipolaris zeicola 26-R-13]EUC34561.1 hypothetical protein COCCADRAFT_93186 [Bipolaris zeicola 26-R-13]
MQSVVQPAKPRHVHPICTHCTRLATCYYVRQHHTRAHTYTDSDTIRGHGSPQCKGCQQVSVPLVLVARRSYRHDAFATPPTQAKSNEAGPLVASRNVVHYASPGYVCPWLPPSCLSNSPYLLMRSSLAHKTLACFGLTHVHLPSRPASSRFPYSGCFQYAWASCLASLLFTCLSPGHRRWMQ